jgi:hypothetical protein
MEKEKLESLLIDYIEGQLSAEQKAEVEKMIANDAETAKLHAQLTEVMSAMDKEQESEPSVSLRMKFESALQAEIQKGKGKQVFFQPLVLRAAAAIGFLVVGVAIGFWVNEFNQRNREIAALKEQVERERQQAEKDKRLMISMLENPQSASQRLMGANVAYEMKQADDDIVRALVKSMNEDSNTNVRLAALDALGKFYKQSHVRNALVNSLSTQKDPMVQIALIRLLVQMKEKEVVNELEQITRDGTVIKAVKDEAHAGILKLS